MFSGELPHQLPSQLQGSPLFPSSAQAHCLQLKGKKAQVLGSAAKTAEETLFTQDQVRTGMRQSEDMGGNTDR